jgi:hypothetical protein
MHHVGRLAVQGATQLGELLVEELHDMKGRFLLGAPLDGWIGVYPGDHGRDPRVAHAVARRLPASCPAC